MNVGDSLSFSFRYTIQKADWYAVLKHTINDIYRFTDFLRLKQTKYSLTQRLYDMHAYLTNDSTSKWHNLVYKGVTIGAQDYLVVCMIQKKRCHEKTPIMELCGCWQVDG